MGKMKQYVIEDVVVLALRSVAPLSMIYVIYRIGVTLGNALASPSYLYTLPWPLEVLIYLEVAFFVYMSWRTFMLGRRSHPPRITREERRMVLERCLVHTDDVEQWVSGWFFDVPYHQLSVQDLRNLAAFMFFSVHPHEIPEGSEDAMEIEEIVDMMQNAAGMRLPDQPPNGKEQICMRHTIDPLKSKHRPIIVYLLTYFLDLLNGVSVRRKGFRRGRIGRITYWHRPGVQGDDLNPPTPLVFVHGIGVGLFLYQNLVSHLARDIACDIFLVELPHASLQLRADVPDPTEGVAALKSMLAKYGHSRAVFVGHSLGSIYVSWMCRFSPRSVVGSVFIEPIVFLLHLKTVTHSFLYQEYGGIVGYLIRSELFLNHALRRAFWWYLNVLFVEDISHECTIFLCQNDEVVPTQAVVDYLQRHEHGRQLSRQIFDNEFHGKWMFEEESMQRVCGAISYLHTKVSDLYSIREHDVRLCVRDEEEGKGSASY